MVGVLLPVVFVSPHTLIASLCAWLDRACSEVVPGVPACPGDPEGDPVLWDDGGLPLGGPIDSPTFGLPLWLWLLLLGDPPLLGELPSPGFESTSVSGEGELAILGLTGLFEPDPADRALGCPGCWVLLVV